MATPRRPAQFDWLGEQKGRRGNLRMVRQALRAGWLDPLDNESRLKLLAGLGEAAENMDTEAEFSAFAELCYLYIDMDRKNIRSRRDALEELRAREGSDLIEAAKLLLGI